MSAKVIWIHIGLVALFAGGVAGGILYHHHFMHAHDTVRRHGVHPSGGHDSTHTVDQFRSRLNLTDEQTSKVKDVLDGLHKEMMGPTTEFRDKFSTLRSRAWADIRASLSEKQLLEFERLIEEMEKKHTFH